MYPVTLEPCTLRALLLGIESGLMTTKITFRVLPFFSFNSGVIYERRGINNASNWPPYIFSRDEMQIVTRPIIKGKMRVLNRLREGRRVVRGIKSSLIWTRGISLIFKSIYDVQKGKKAKKKSICYFFRAHVCLLEIWFLKKPKGSQKTRTKFNFALTDGVACYLKL